MDDVWSDTDVSMTTPRSPSPLSSYSAWRPPSLLTTYQKSLISAYKFHSNRVSDLMNTIVDLEISVRRERDEPSLQYLVEELEEAREELILHRDAKRKKGREINKEEENLKMVVGIGATMARKQLSEIGTYMERDRVIVCLR
jgi:hypothetical protein